MNKYSTLVGVALIVVLTLSSGLMHGKLTNRFGSPQDMNESQKRLAGLKKRLETESFGERGQWKMVKTTKMADLIVEELECVEYLNASFVNSEMPDVHVDGFIVLGPFGPISVHNPEVCYSSREYEIKGPPKPVKIFDDEKKKDEFFGMTMRSNDVNADVQRVYYSWASDGPWTATRTPRVIFGGSPKLFKMQLASKVASDANLDTADNCKNFLRDFLPLVQAQLFAPTDK